MSVSATSTEPLRVAYVVHSFGTGGIERCVANLTNHLDREHFLPTVVCLDRTGEAENWLTHRDVPIVELCTPASNDWGTVRRFARALRDNKIEVVHSHNWGTLVETVIARRLAGVRAHVHTEHGQGLHEGLRGVKKWVRRWARRLAFGMTSQVVACADSVRPLIEQQSGFPAERIRFMPNGVEALPDGNIAPAELRGQLGLDDATFIWGSVGRLAKVKQFPLAIDATVQLRERGYDAHLVLIGDGPEMGRLQDHAAASGHASAIHLVGRHSEVFPWLQLLDVYINCSKSEAMSMGILEALFAGLPVVAADVGDNRSIIDGEGACGLAARPGSATALADEAERVLKDIDLRRTFAANAVQRFNERYTIEQMARSHQQLYSRLCRMNGK